ncbi:MAG: hypothetical protein INF16_04795 [Methylobacterium sp.]|nr:hypothetical protein [Methylobacterium sp.]
MKADDGLIPEGGSATLKVHARMDEKIGKTVARVTLDPQTRNANLAIAFGSGLFGDKLKPDIEESTAALADEVNSVVNGDLSLASRVLASQAFSLDAVFTEMARRSANNLGEYPDAADRYMRLALKAQSACRSTLEALAKLHQPREQTVRHVHVNEGGQAVIADQFHHHTGGQEFGKSVKQSHATRTARQGKALPSEDARGNRVPIPGSEGETAMQDARRNEPGSA